MNTNEEKERLEEVKESILSAQNLYLGSEKQITATDIESLLSENTQNIEQVKDLDAETKQRFTMGDFQYDPSICTDQSIVDFNEELRNSRK